MTAQDAYITSLNNPSEFEKNKEYYESFICKDMYFTHKYSIYVLRDRFELGEYTICKYGMWFRSYIFHVINNKYKNSFYYKFI